MPRRANGKRYLLDAGAQVLRKDFEEGRFDPLRAINTSAIAQAANVSRANLYQGWPSDSSDNKLASYRRDLVRHIVTEMTFDAPAVRNLAFACIDQPMEELVRQVAEFDFCRYASGGENAQSFRFAAFMTIVAENSRVVNPGEYPAAYEDLVELYKMLLTRYNREMMSGFEVEDLVECFWAMLDGFTMHSWHFERLTREREWQGASSWSMFSISILSLVQTLTREKESS